MTSETAGAYFEDDPGTMGLGTIPSPRREAIQGKDISCICKAMYRQ